MRGETTCPTCHGPAEWAKVSYSIGSLGDKPIMRQKRMWRSTADPARLARLESLLRLADQWVSAWDDLAARYKANPNHTMDFGREHRAQARLRDAVREYRVLLGPAK